MSLENFIPAVWAGMMLPVLHKTQVYSSEIVVNRDYQGEIAGLGDSVKINQIGPVTVSTYSKNTSIGNPQVLTDAQTTLLIDQAEYFNFLVDDVDQAQQNPKIMQTAMNEAAYALADSADQKIAALYNDVAAANRIGDTGSAVTLSAAADLYDNLILLDTRLSEANIPTGNRWVVLPPWAYGLIKKDSRFVSNSAPANQVLLNGLVGSAGGLQVLVSNNVPKTSATSEWRIIAGYRGACTYAEQIVKVEAYRPPTYFADAVRGLHVYGRKLVRPQGWAMLTVNRPAFA